jgi:ribonuclease HI
VTDTRPDEDVHFVIRRELSLLQPDAHVSTAQVEALLHPDFCDIAASGQRLERREVIAALGRPARSACPASPPPGNGAGSPAGPAATISGLTGVRLSGTVILVSYTSEQGGQRSRHSSLWLKTGPSWRRYFHQGTPITPG